MAQLITIFMAGLIATSLGTLISIPNPSAIAWNAALDSVTCNLNLTGLDVSQVNVSHRFRKTSKTFQLSEYQQLVSYMETFGGVLQLLLFAAGFNEQQNSLEIEVLINTANLHMPDVHFLFFNTYPYTISQYYNFPKDYPRAVSYGSSIGKVIAQFIVNLVSCGVNLDNIEILCESLSCPTMAHAAQHYITMSGGSKIRRITGLDPARPCFDNSEASNQLSADDATFVDIIHSNTGELGTDNKLGTVNIFGDGEGLYAKQCLKYSGNGLIAPLLSVCSHFFSVVVWMASVKNNSSIIATQCNSYSDFKAGKCAGNDQTYVGIACSPIKTGNFYFNSADFLLEEVMVNGVFNAYFKNFAGLPVQ